MDLQNFVKIVLFKIKYLKHMQLQNERKNVGHRPYLGAWATKPALPHILRHKRNTTVTNTPFFINVNCLACGQLKELVYRTQL